MHAEHLPATRRMTQICKQTAIVLHESSSMCLQGEQRGSKAAKKQLRLLPELDYDIDDICISSSSKFAAVCGSHRNVSMMDHHASLPFSGQ